MAAPAHNNTGGDTGATGVRVSEDWMTGPAVAPVIAALAKAGSTSVSSAAACAMRCSTGRWTTSISAFP